MSFGDSPDHRGSRLHEWRQAAILSRPGGVPADRLPENSSRSHRLASNVPQRRAGRLGHAAIENRVGDRANLQHISSTEQRAERAPVHAVSMMVEFRRWRWRGRDGVGVRFAEDDPEGLGFRGMKKQRGAVKSASFAACS